MGPGPHERPPAAPPEQPFFFNCFLFFSIFSLFFLFSHYCGVEFGHVGVPLASLFHFFHYQGPSRPLTCTAATELRDFPPIGEKVVMDRLQEFRLKRKGYDHY